jgi:hypothetical protein
VGVVAEVPLAGGDLTGGDALEGGEGSALVGHDPHVASASAVSAHCGKSRSVEDTRFSANACCYAVTPGVPERSTGRSGS